MTTITTGLHEHVPFGTYQDWPAISKHDLDHIAKSPAHYYTYKNSESVVTPAMNFGTACHTAILEPETIADAIAVLPKCDRRTKAGKALVKEFELNSFGQTIVTEDEMYRIDAMRDSVMSHSIASKLVLDAAHIEASALWSNALTGGLCRCRPDIIHDDIVVDLKTTADASRWSFASAMHKYRYHVQAAYYLDGLIGLGVVKPNAAFAFLVVEKQPPHAVAIYAVQQEDLDRGRLQYERDLIRYSECTKKNHWPGYSEAIGYIDLPIFSRREIDALTGNH